MRTLVITVEEEPSNSGVVITTNFSSGQEMRDLYAEAEANNLFSVTAIHLLSAIVELNDASERSAVTLNGKPIKL